MSPTNQTLKESSNLTIHSERSAAFFSDDSDQDWKRYLFETAQIKIIQETVQAGIEITTEITLYIRDYGKEEARYIKETRNIKMMNRIEESNKRTIMTMDKLVTIDEDGSVHEMKNPAGEFMQGMDQQKAQQFSQNMLKGMDAKESDLPDETIGGKDCTCKKTVAGMAGISMTTIQCSYKQFPFKITSEGMGMNSSEIVVEFKEGISIDKKHFEY